MYFFFSVDMDDSQQFIDGRKIHDGERVPKHAPIGYCDSKLMNAIFARELADRHKVQKNLDLRKMSLLESCTTTCKIVSCFKRKKILEK